MKTELKTAESIAQWVIDNRYPKSENDKVSDHDIYHTVKEAIESHTSERLDHLRQQLEDEIKRTEVAFDASIYHHGLSFAISLIDQLKAET